MKYDVDVAVALRSPAQRGSDSAPFALDNDQSEDLRVGQDRKDYDDHGDRVSRSAEHVLAERELDGDESLKGHAEHEPAGH